MAPALTSEAATRARETLQSAPTSPGFLLVNGRVSHLSMNNTAKGVTRDMAPHSTSPAIKTTQIITIAKDPQKIIGNSGIVIDSGEKPLTKKVASIGNTADLLTNQTKCQQPKTTKLLSSISTTPVLFSGNGTIHTTTNGNVIMTGSTNLQSSLTRSQPATSGSGLRLSPMNTMASGFVPTMTCTSKNLQNTPKMISSSMPSTSHNSQNSTISYKDAGLTNGSITTMRIASKSAISSSPTVNSNIQIPVVKKTTANAQSSPYLLESIARKQKMLEVRAGRLLRRLRRLQSRQAVSHTKQQLSQLVDHQRQVLPSTSKSGMDLQTELLHSKSMSTAALVELVHKMQSSQSAHRQKFSGNEESEDVPSLGEDCCSELDKISGLLICSMSHLQSTMDSDATESSSGGESCDELDYDDDWDGKIPRPPIQCRAEWRWASDRASVASRWTWLQAQVSDLEYRIRQQYDIYKQIRANKGSVVLGEPPPPIDIVARTQLDKSGQRLSSLDERIANFPAKNEISPANISTLLSNVNRQSSQLSNQLGSLYTPHPSPSSMASSSSNSTFATPKTPSTLNGFVDGVNQSCEDASRIIHQNASSPTSDHTFHAARCRPVKTYRKRKLLKTGGLHHSSRKAARLSTILCHCYPPISPCSLCGGRYNNTQQMDAASMPITEKVALVDHSYHAVLSFPQDVGLSTHSESMMKSGAWQQRHVPKSYKMIVPDRKRLKVKDGAKKYQRRLKKNQSATILSSTKIRNKYELKQTNRNHVNSPVKQPSTSDFKLSRGEIRLKKRKAKALQKIGKNTNMETQGDDSLSQSGQSQIWRDALRKKRGENAYDIDNIVIPYSIAASTRVEKLQYKEIITPKWRKVGSQQMEDSDSDSQSIEDKTLIPDSNSPPPPPPVEPSEPPQELHSDPDDTEVEDVTDDIFRQRHLRCEILEKKSFAMALSKNTNNQRKNRGAQRADSTTSLTNADSSISEIYQPETNLCSTPPDTPTKVQSPAPPSLKGQSPAPPSLDDIDEVVKTVKGVTRRRSSSVSSTKSIRSQSASHTEDHQIDDRPVIQPWNKRTFPLDDNEFELLQQVPSLSRIPRTTSTSSMGTSVKVITEITRDGVPRSPVPCDNSDTASDIIEDPDDPEWTVISERQQQPKQPNLVLKLAKR